jgi:hypothetical protein
MFIIALAGEQRPGLQGPNVFIQYRCEQGHHFETLKTFDGTHYEECYMWLDLQPHTIRDFIN